MITKPAFMNLLNLFLKTEPANEPVLLGEFKTFLRVDTNEEDETLKGYLKTARARAELYTNRAFITQTYEAQLNAWPEDSLFEVPKSPMQSVTEIRVFAEDNTSTVFAASNYFVNIKATPGIVYVQDTNPEPTRKHAGIEVEFVAGYGNTKADVPEPIRTAIMQWAAYIYEKRTISDIPPDTAKNLLQPYKVFYL